MKSTMGLVTMALAASALAAQVPLTLPEAEATLKEIYDSAPYLVTGCRSLAGSGFFFVEVQGAATAEVFEELDGMVVNVATFDFNGGHLQLRDVVSGGTGTISKFERIAEYLRASPRERAESLSAMHLDQLTLCPTSIDES